MTKKSEEKIFENKFIPKDYLSTYYPSDFDLNKFIQTIKWLEKKYKKNTKEIDIQEVVNLINLSHETVENILMFKFQRRVARHLLNYCPQGSLKILDVGGGPTIYQHIAVSLLADSIIHSDYLDKNRLEVVRWLNNENDCYNWDNYFKFNNYILKNDKAFVSQLIQNTQSENEKIKSKSEEILQIINNELVDRIKSNLRNAIKDVIHGNVFVPELEIDDDNDYDLVSSNFSIESATSSHEYWEKGMNNVLRKIKLGGFLSLAAIRHADWYQVGNERMPAININENHIIKFLGKSGLKIRDFMLLRGSKKDEVGYDGLIFVLAQKK